MSWTQQLFNYCERAAKPELWAEPLNAVSNLAFIFAALTAYGLAKKAPQGKIDLSHYFLILLVFVVGVGSALFHTFATRWAVMADVIPIAIFIFSFLIFSLYRFLNLRVIGTICGIGVFIFISWAMAQIKCDGGPCLNGSIGYLPALLALLLIGFALRIKSHPASAGLLLAAAVFSVSVIFRSIDNNFCDMTKILGYSLGTHFLWHSLNGLMLYILLRTAILHTDLKPQKATNTK